VDLRWKFLPNGFLGRCIGGDTEAARLRLYKDGGKWTLAGFEHIEVWHPRKTLPFSEAAGTGVS
jgi:hypothetical protein